MQNNMNKSQLKVCLVAPLPPPFGGIANWTRLVRRYAQMRTDLTLQIVDTAPRWRAIDDQALRNRALGGAVQLGRDYVRFLLKMRTCPSLVHLTTSGHLSLLRDLVFLAKAKRSGIPSIYHLHFGRLPQIASENKLEWKILAKAIQMAHTIIAIDPDTMNMLKQRFPQVRIIRIPNGIDLNELPLSVTRTTLKTVLFLGWVIPTKGTKELVQAWARLRMEGWRCVIAGPGSEIYREELRQHFQPENLEFLIEQTHSDALQLMAASDVFVLPSHSEGFPNVIVEAMILGKPIIATSVGAIPEMLSGGCGVLVPPHDAEALGKTIREVCSNEVLRKAMGSRAQLKARTEYAMDHVFDQLISAWCELANSEGQGKCPQ